MRQLIYIALGSVLVSVTAGCEPAEETDQQQQDQPTAEQQQADQQETDDQQADQQEADQQQNDEQNGEPAADVDKTITLQPEGNQMKYKQTEITAQAGQTIELVMENTATDKAMKHNIVVLNTDDSSTAMEVAQAGWSLPDQEYVPEHEAIVANTPMADPGETTRTTMTVPDEPGEYLYICTYPGHYPSMKGTLIVEE